ncbi:hypothetical protein M378DRAFT_186372 [Amanita muscaria Koide BX008]|uniref:Uncharacterized protein n=1 Tax=Amanita muscaria (strain Koide BX008) TaxID=946122 RepID=A0A0C2XAE8_AMAMK|nr:hypothetical protein M378DRAFT_186372 [Amanita muscaria Koide BX008]
MGGDHKCPVCQATFTRPQHVARHMRSHTGDRPYKCLYCGDQFARSDLLSRHCNKCHANEKPLPNSGSRRRGSASAARATTSKQACDQCVQSSLPCDGSNPCAKCVQRKCRCTYVKFHRQTAPVGPGHSNPRPGTAGNPSSSIGGVNSSLPNISSSSRMPMYSHIDEFLLGQQQPLAPSMPDNLFSQSLGFPPLYSHAADPSQPVPPLTDNTDLGPAKFRQHPDPYRRASLPVSIQASTAAPGAGMMPGLYADPRQSNWMTWGQENDPSFITTNHHPEAIHDKNSQAELPHPYMGTQGLLVPPTGEGPHSHYADHRDRRRSSDYTSEGSSTSQSVPSSATSSSVHLPMEGMNLHHQFPSDHAQTYPLVAAPHHDRAYTTRSHEGGFSSEFGLMSLDDPNVLAGLASDGAPFFSDDAMSTLGADDPNQTPMPAKQLRSNAVSTPSKEAEIRELREFWKQYIRTPLSGPGPMGSAATEAPGPQPQRHASTSRRPRVASLPNTKSPFSVEHAQSQRKDENNPTSSIRTTLHGQEDLRSYEAAVLARKTPTLSLGPRARRNNTISTSSASPSLTPSPQVPTLQIDSNLNYSYSPGSSRPSSATGPPMMAHWSGKLPPVRLGYPHDTLSTSSPPSRESSLSIDDGTGSGGSDREGMRPSCKRLPSQTLGPSNTKRAQVSHEELGGRPSSTSSSGVPMPVYNQSSGGGGVAPDGGNVNVNTRPSIPVTGGGYIELGRRPSLTEMRPPHAQLHHIERPIANLVVDRHRKMSVPTMTPSMPAFTFVAPPGPGPGANR